MKLISTSHSIAKLFSTLAKYVCAPIVALSSASSFAQTPSSNATVYSYESKRFGAALVGGISNSSVVAGTLAKYASGNTIGCIFNTNGNTFFPLPSAQDKSFQGLNSSNTVVGYNNFYATNPGPAFILKNGVYTYLYPPGVDGPVSSSYANSISDVGDVVGTFQDRLGYHGFIYSKGVFKVLNIPGAAYTSATGINNLGAVTVVAQPSLLVGPTSSYIYQNGAFTLRNVPGASSSFVAGINDYGSTIYNYVQQRVSKSAVYDNGTLSEIKVPGASATQVKGINNSGIVVGNANSSVFVAYPIR